MERPLSSDELMDMLAKREQEDMTPAERKAVRDMPTPVSKPSTEDIAVMKEAGRQEFKDNKARVIEHLKGKGLSNAAIAGIVGNIEVETGGSFDFTQKQTKSGDPRSPETVEGGGYGLFQFDNPRNKAGHETWYKDYLKQTNKEDSTESQLDYFLDMVTAGEDSKNPFYKYSSNMGAGNAGVIKAYLETNQNPSQISDAITDRFEKASIKHSDRRRKAAEAAFAELQPSDRTDIDSESQNINQAGPITDTGEDTPIEEERRFQNVPILRHFFAEGGAIPMERQMEMFEDGGLMDEGGTVDPVSGNDVPPGSTQEEVRDDIPAQLSEGEFVIPADVVRYIGLGNLMQMRQEAKLGLKMMEEMGQMGNSEEATMPDDLPFDINDLDMEDEPQYNVGGFVPATQQQQQFGISGFQQAAAPTTGVAQLPVQAASQQFVQPSIPQQAAVPTMKQYKPEEIPTFEQTIGSTPGQYDELRSYKNEAGMTMQIPFKNGQPIYPIPEGYKFVDPEAIATEEVTTTPTTPQTTSVRDTSDDDDDERRRKEEEEMFGPGGGRLGVGGKTYGVSFDMPEGFMPGVSGIAGTAFGLLSGKPLPDNVTVNFQRGKDKFTVTGQEYNAIKQKIKTNGANSEETKDFMDDVRRNAAEREAKRRDAAELNRMKELAKTEEMQKLVEKAKETAAVKAAEKERQERIAKAAKEKKQYQSSIFDDPKSDDDGGGSTPGGGGVSRDVREAVADAGGYTGGGKYGGFAEGGLASKPKPKAKKMKRGGLASKK